MIRIAVPSDRGVFSSLWMDYLKEQRALGSPTHADTHNLLRFRDYFEAYASGLWLGATWIDWDGDEPTGLALAGMLGEESDNWHTDAGRMANLWGVYVRPEYRGKLISMKLFRAAAIQGAKWGVDTVEGFVRTGNSPGDRIALISKAIPLETHYMWEIGSLETKDG